MRYEREDRTYNTEKKEIYVTYDTEMKEIYTQLYLRFSRSLMMCVCVCVSVCVCVCDVNYNRT